MHRQPIALLLLPFILGIATPAVAEESAGGGVKVERRAPDKGGLASLRFLHANRDFLRGRLDLLREKPLPGEGQARGLDERQLLLRRILDEIEASRDSVRTEGVQLAGDAMLGQLNSLSRLEDQLDRMDRLTDRQEDRLHDLDEALRGEQETALIVLLKGLPPQVDPAKIAIRDDDGASWNIRLDAAQRAALRRGGLVQVLHEYMEPRLHRLEFSLGGDGLLEIAADTPRDQLTLLQLDLSGVSSTADLSAASAKIWQD
ncbi:MAG: hypothetical protein R3C71_08080 [Candidatus Krumholzibacteriia bacterium]|nr:hypothetical protein [bacterium]MCB9514115.1 hypothetical protein [Candidatus Latescibacterota bacterium]MCB9515661.1 hypothetical protein [Candidatus Latescibacterota bacterium]